MLEQDSHVEMWRKNSRLWERRAKENQQKSIVWASALLGVLGILEIDSNYTVEDIIRVLRKHVESAEKAIQQAKRTSQDYGDK